MKTNKVKVIAYCLGVAKGDRKVKNHSYELRYIKKGKTADLTEEDINKCVESTRLWADARRFKSVNNLKVKFIEVEVDDGAIGGMPSESYLMFSETDKEIVIQ